MSFKIVLLPNAGAHWPDALRRAVPGIEVAFFDELNDAAAAAIEDADAAFGTVPPELLARARKLRWISAPMAGLGGRWFYDELIQSDVTVTNVSGIYNEHLAGHIMGFVLAFSRRLDFYIPQQVKAPLWQHGPEPIELSERTALIVGVGGAGSEAARLCNAFGMRVIGVDPRETRLLPGLSEIVTPDHMDEKLPEADFVILTIPESPGTVNLFNADKFARMKQGSYIINIGRGVTIVTEDLMAALRSGKLAGAGLDVINPEPLPSGHPIWSMPGVLITPHIAISGSRDVWEQRRLELLIDNCQRFEKGEPLRNMVDKKNWF